MDTQKQENYFRDWKNREEIAEAMIPIIGRLYRENGLVTTIYGRKLVNKSTIDILRAHRFARQILENEISVRDSFPVLEAISKLDLAPARVDIGKLTVRYQAQGSACRWMTSSARSSPSSTPARPRSFRNRAM